MQNAVLHQQSFYPVMKKSSHRKDLWSSKRTTPLFDFSLEQVKEAGWTLQAFTYDLHHNKELNKENIMTEYEEKFSSKGNPINKLIAMRK